MAGRKTDLPGKKLSVWVSGENQRRLAEQGLTPGEAIARGLEARDRVPVPPETRDALRWLGRLAEAVANGARLVTVEEDDGSATARAVADDLAERYAMAAVEALLAPEIQARDRFAREPDGEWAYRVPAKLAERYIEVVDAMPEAEVSRSVRQLRNWLHHGGGEEA